METQTAPHKQAESAEKAGTTRACLVYATFPGFAPAEEAARELVQSGLVACANIIPSVASIYRWNGVLERAEEAVLLLKTTHDRTQELTQTLQQMHPYDVPAIIVLPLEGGLPAYLDWISTETRHPETA
ncbi:divalent-cation tolerance protein CutA [Xanthobacter sp. TB0139]